MFNTCQLYRDAEHGYQHFEVLNIREFPLHQEEHHELVTNPSIVIIQELLESEQFPGVILTVETYVGPGIEAYELQQSFPSKPQVGEVYEVTMTRPFLNQERSYCTLEYKKVGQWEKDNKGVWQLTELT